MAMARLRLHQRTHRTEGQEGQAASTIHLLRRRDQLHGRGDHAVRLVQNPLTSQDRHQLLSPNVPQHLFATTYLPHLENQYHPQAPCDHDIHGCHPALILPVGHLLLQLPVKFPRSLTHLLLRLFSRTPGTTTLDLMAMVRRVVR